MRAKIKMFSLVPWLLSGEGAAGRLEVCFALSLGHSGPSKLGFTEASSIILN